MAVSVLLALVGFAVLALSAYAASPSTQHLTYTPHHLLSESKLWSLFEAWNTKHGKHYGSSHAHEKQHRFQIFRDNLMLLDAHNHNDNPSFMLGLNRFADLTHEEFMQSRRLGLKHAYPKMGFIRRLSPAARRHSKAGRQPDNGDMTQVPDSVDWRALGAVTEVKDQGMCGEKSIFALKHLALLQSGSKEPY
ncbi:hypothetical protein GOP47_0005251 [Adiantum capillus-veneris]|uniref:Cathepsin propeptide inhibitor domain-containing protein n=1 Tax=Adiantum capillus-veneris TaxID=13818 RepID=A0A9D4V5H5_ADICA|nr:hypothetical protein GOP47_0005251 [Adiantum capillus-veneris]